MNSNGFEKMYEAQFFGFTPKSFVDGVYNSFQIYMDEAIESIEKCIANEFADYSKREIEVVMNTVHESVRREIEKRFDDFETFAMKAIFNLPNNVVLPEDKVHISHANVVEEEGAVRSRIRSLEDDIAAMKYETAKMEAELQTIAEVQAYCDQIRDVVVAIKRQFVEAGVDDIGEMMRFLTQKVNQLNQLKTEIAPLPDSSATTSHSLYDSLHHQVDPTTALTLLSKEEVA